MKFFRKLGSNEEENVYFNLLRYYHYIIVCFAQIRPRGNRDICEVAKLARPIDESQHAISDS